MGCHGFRSLVGAAHAVKGADVLAAGVLPIRGAAGGDTRAFDGVAGTRTPPEWAAP